MTDQIDLIKEELSGSYAIERAIGRGGMATVYLAQDLKHDRPVALKVLRPELALAVGVERFTREIKYAAALQHPHILPVYDSGTARGQLYYVMPYVAGESIADRISSQGQLPVDEVLQIAANVASALQYAHDQGVIHRDIKPANIMLSGGNAVVADFGVAMALGGVEDRLTHTGIAIGTPAYMSPEQATGEGDVDGRSDIYSLGCVMYEMLVGDAPYRGNTVQATIAQRFTESAPEIRKLRGDVPLSVERTVARAMAKMPADRFQSGAEFVRVLEATRSGETSIGAPLTNRRTLLVATIAILAVAAGMWLRPQLGGRGSVVPGADVIAVVPFNASGVGVDLLGEGMVDLLSANLDGVGGIRTIDPRAVLNRWRRDRPEGPLNLSGELDVGSDLEAGAILRGSVTQGGPVVRIAAELIGIDGSQLARVRVDGPADSVLSLVDNLSVLLLREVWRSQEAIPDLRVAAITTGSLDAVRAYLRGEQHYRRSEWDSAITYFERAAEHDSSFALAFFRLTHAYGWLEGHGSTSAIANLARGQRHRARLPRREQQLLASHDLFEQGRAQSVDELRDYVALYPSDAEGWYELADAQFHAQAMLAIPTSEILAAFDRAIELIPTLSAAAIHPVEISISNGDRGQFDHYVNLLQAAGDSIGAAGFRLIGTAVWGNGDIAGQAMIEVARDRSRQLDLVFQAYLNAGRGDVDRILGALDQAASTGDSSEAAFLRVIKARFLAGLGRLEESRSIIDSIFNEQPPLVVLASIYPVIAGFADPSFGTPGVAVLGGVSPDNSIGAYLKALFASAMNNSIGARAEISAASAVTTASDTSGVDGLLTAALGRVILLEGDTLNGVAMMRSGIDNVGFAPGLSGFLGPVRFEMGLALTRNPDTQDEGINVLRYGLRDEMEYRAMAALALARALEDSGDVSSAVVEYSRFVRMWSGADPELQPAVSAARNALARLVGESST